VLETWEVVVHLRARPIKGSLGPWGVLPKEIKVVLPDSCHERSKPGPSELCVLSDVPLALQSRSNL
jgi:hypothetical protein